MPENNELERTLWAIADKMRANIDASDVRMRCWIDLPQICS